MGDRLAAGFFPALSVIRDYNAGCREGVYFASLVGDWEMVI